MQREGEEEEEEGEEGEGGELGEEGEGVGPQQAPDGPVAL